MYYDINKVAESINKCNTNYNLISFTMIAFKVIICSNNKVII